MNLINNSNIVFEDENNSKINMLGGKYICDPNKNYSNQICIPKQKIPTLKSEKNIFKTKTECENECEKKFINVQLKKSKLFNESLQFYFFIRDLIKKENMKIYIKGGNVIGMALLKLIYEEYSNNDVVFEKVFKKFLLLELIKDWDFTAYTDGKETDDKYRHKLDKLSAKYKLVPRAKTFILYQTKIPILVYDKALFEIAIIPEDTPFSKMEIPLTTMKIKVDEHSLKYIFIMAKNFYSYQTKSIPFDLKMIKKIMSKTNVIIHPHKDGLYDPGSKIDPGDLNEELIIFINDFTNGNKYWTQFFITQIEDPYRLIYRMPEKNITKTKKINEFIKINLPKTSKPDWLLDTDKTMGMINKFIDKLGTELKKIYSQTKLLESTLDFLDGANFGKPQIQIEWDQFNHETKNRIRKIFEPTIKIIGKNDFKKMVQSLMEKYQLDKLKPIEMTNTQRIIKFFNFLNEINFF